MKDNQITNNYNTNNSYFSYYVNDYNQIRDNHQLTSTIVYSEKSNNTISCSRCK